MSSGVVETSEETWFFPLLAGIMLQLDGFDNYMSSIVLKLLAVVVLEQQEIGSDCKPFWSKYVL